MCGRYCEVELQHRPRETFIERAALSEDPTNDELFDHALQGYARSRIETAAGLHQSGVLGQLSEREHAVGLIQQSVKVIEDRLAAMPGHEQKECAAGCAYCCHQRIDVTALEALAIAGALELTRDAESLEEIRWHLRDNADLVRDMTKAEQAQARVPCALLSEEGACSIYPVRPVPCIGWHSMSRDQCEQNFEHGSGAGEGIPLDMAVLLESKGFWFGLSDALARQGLPADRYEIHSAVLRALETSDAARRWLSGEPIFDGCTPGQADADTVMQYESDEGHPVRLVWKPHDDGGGEFVVGS